MPPIAKIPDELLPAAQILWDYHDLGQEPTAADVAIGLGSHDLGVADHTVECYRAGLFSLMLFTGATSSSTADRFPDGEAEHYRRRAIAAGVPEEHILVEPHARNTPENITRSRDLLRAHGIEVAKILLVCRPYQQRRADAICRTLWPEVEVTCTSQRKPLALYVAGIRDPDLVLNTMVADTQRITLDATSGNAAPQNIPAEVCAAYDHLVAAGYNHRVIA